MPRRFCALALIGFAAACGDVVHHASIDAPPQDTSIDDAATPDTAVPVDAAPFLCKTPMAVGGIPADTSKPGWQVSRGASGSNDSGSTPGMLLIGDDLVVDTDPQTTANAIRFFRGTDAVVLGAAGASVAHFNSESLIKPSGLSTLAQYEAFFGTVRITILALGSHDARIVTTEQAQKDGYTIDEFAHQVDLAVTSGLSHSQCVLLVNVANRWELAARPVVEQVNGVIGCAAKANNTRIRTADWDAFSAQHPEWFLSKTDIHHSDAGKTAYRDFLNEAIAAAMAAGC